MKDFKYSVIKMPWAMYDDALEWCIANLGAAQPCWSAMEYTKEVEIWFMYDADAVAFILAFPSEQIIYSKS